MKYYEKMLDMGCFTKDDVVKLAGSEVAAHHERELIQLKMTQLGTGNMSTYLRKIAIDGYVIKLELPELKEMISLLRRSSNNLNQLTKRVHETGHIYDADLEDIIQNQERLWRAANDILTVLAEIK